MKTGLSRILIIIVSILISSTTISAQSRPRLRISLENTETHVQTQAVMKFAQELRLRMQDSIEVEVYHSARLYRDSQVVSALVRGDIEMAVPGTWQLGKYIPETDYFLLPDFYGATSADMDQLLDQPVGRDIIRRIESKLNVVIPGDWMDLGPAHIFTTKKPIKRISDLNGLRIRVAGGIVNKMRIEALGAEAVIIAWPDLPPRIRDGYVDGILTTFETIRSAELWKYGLKYAYTDSEYFPQYVPMVSSSFWQVLTSRQQQVFSDVWNQAADDQKKAAAEAQWEARAIAEKNGIQIFSPSYSEIRSTRFLLHNERSGMVQSLSSDPDFLALDNR